MPTLDEQIAEMLAESIASGELQSAPSFGKPLQAVAGWDATPGPLRMPFKILKDAGFVPPEVPLLHERAVLKAQVEAATDAADCQRLRQRLSELDQRLALRLEALQRHARL